MISSLDSFPMTHCNRAVSPVIGVVLLIAVTVTLAVIIVPVILSIAGGATDSAPQSDVSFSYTEAVDRSTEDSFGNTGENAHGLVRIALEGGDHLNPAEISVLATPSGGNLLDEGVFDSGETFQPGQSITVWANRDDAVELVWMAPEADESAPLALFSVLPIDDVVPPGAPTPDEDCGWVEDQLDGADDLDVDGLVVHCDLDGPNIDDIENVTIENGGAIIGNVLANEDVYVEDGATYAGWINGTDIDIVDDAEINSNVWADGQVDIEAAVVDGHIDADDDVDIAESEVFGDVRSGGGVDVYGSTITGDVVATGDVTVDEGTEITGDVILEDAGSELDCGDGTSTINGEPCREYKAPEFVVRIEDTSGPIEEGETQYVYATVENVGLETGTQTIDLDIDGGGNDTTVDNLAREQPESVTLKWETESGNAGDYTANVSSDDDYDLEDITVYEVGEAPPVFEWTEVELELQHDENLRDTEFNWSLNREGTVTMEIEDDDGSLVDDESITDDESTSILDGQDTPLEVTLRTEIEDSECYEVDIPTDATDGDVFDLIDDGISC